MKACLSVLFFLLGRPAVVVAVDRDSVPWNQRRSYSFTVDTLLKRVAAGRATNDTMLELGRRNDSRIRPVLERAARGYVSASRQWMRDYDKAHETHSEQIAANDFNFQLMEQPVIDAAKKAAARQGNQQYFDEFVVGLSSTNGRYRLECIKTLGYIGDRAALKFVVPIIDDCSFAYRETSTWEGSKGAVFCSEALRALHTLIPMDDAFEKNFPVAHVAPDKSLIDMWRPAIKRWWALNRDKYEALPYGKDKSFDYIVYQ